MNQPLINNVISIPELFNIICLFLSNSDLFHCSTVSKTFSITFTPALWHTITLKTVGQYRHFTESSEVQAALAKNGKFVRVIQIQTHSSLAPFLKVDAECLQNVYALQFLHSTDHNYEAEYSSSGVSDPLHIDTAQGSKWLETMNTFRLKIPDWLNERNVFLMYYGIASKYNDFYMHQIKRSRQLQLKILYQLLSLAQQRIADCRRVLDNPAELESISSKENDSLLRDIYSLHDRTSIFINRLSHRNKVQASAFDRRLREILRDLNEARHSLADLHNQFQQISESNLQRQIQSQIPIHQSTQTQKLSPQQHRQTPSQQLIQAQYRRSDMHELIAQQQSIQLRRQQIWMETSVPSLPNIFPMTTVEATSSLDGSKPLTWDNDKIEDQKLLQRFLAHVPGVRVFDDSKMPASHGSSMNALIDKLRKQELQSLSIVYCDPLPMECMESQGLILDSCSQGLETLRFSGTFDSRTQINNEILTANDTNRTASMKFIASLGIKQLLLEGNLAFQVRPSFISRCPNLRSLSLGVQSEGMVTSASGCIREYCPLLEELAVTFVNSNINPSCLVGLLEACGNVEPHLSSSSDFSIQESLSYTMSTLTRRVGLKKLVLSGIDFSQHRHSIIKTLCRQQSSTLTFIAIRSCKNIWSNDSATDGEEVVLCKLLTSLQKLEYIDFSLSGFAPVNFRDVSKVHASSLASPCMTWPCARTLRVLRIMIDGVSHISEHPTGLQESPQNLGLALENQLKICELLGMLTSLEELTLGIDENDGPLINNFPEWGYQTSCLELTLETGLSLMSGLKQLRLFKVTRMDHRMGQKEIEWVCRSWPHLKDILGLVRYQAELKSEFEAENLTEDEYREIEMLDWIKKYHPELRYT